jgi:hypothetical protein
MADTTQGEYDSEKDALREGIPAPTVWIKHIERAKKDCEDWKKTAKQAIAVYEASSSSEDGGTGETSVFNILHSNIETTVPALYNSTPIPDVRRRFGDPDQIAKACVDVTERSLSYLLDQYDFDGTVEEAVRDGELAGRGTARVRYEPSTVPQMGQDGQPMMGPDGQPLEDIGYQDLSCEHVIWDKWGHGPGRSWSEVQWVYFEHDFTKDDLERLGVDPARIQSLTFNDTKDAKGGDTQTEKTNTGILKTVRGFEVWDKRSKSVLFIAEQDKEDFLLVQPDPLKLEQFFPVPQALQPLRKRKDLTPICPYEVYRPLVAELDKTTRRINSLTGQLRVRGLIDKRLQADLERLKYCEDGQYEPADDASIFAQGGGGLQNAVAHWPMQETIAALQQLYMQREQTKQTIYEVTGLSDVLRGATNPNETLGAQQLKAQVGSQRLSQRQASVARFCRDILRMKAEIICNHFTAQNLSAMTGVQVTPEVEQLLRNDLLRSYRIDIESDSTIRADVSRSQEQMSLFLQGTAQYAQSMASVLQLEPGAKAAIIEIYASFARNFKLGKSAEDALESLTTQAQQPQEDKPDPEQQKLAAEQQRMEMQMQMEQQKLQAEMELKKMDMQLKQLELQVRQQLAQLDVEKAEIDIQAKRENVEIDRQAKVFDMQTRQAMSEADLTARQRKADQEHELRERKAEMGTEAAE